MEAIQKTITRQTARGGTWGSLTENSFPLKLVYLRRAKERQTQKGHVKVNWL